MSPFNWHPCWVISLRRGSGCLVTEMHGMPPIRPRGYVEANYQQLIPNLLFLYCIIFRLVLRRSDVQTVWYYEYGTDHLFVKDGVFLKFSDCNLPSRRYNTVRCTVRCQAGTASAISASEWPLRPNLPFLLPGVLLPCADATQCFHE